MKKSRPASWNSLKVELDRWSDLGLVADLFIRDDDASSASDELDRLLAAVGDTPLGLAVIPGILEASLVERLKEAPRSVQVWQHGWTHRNWATDENSEYPGFRDHEEVAAELAEGKRVLQQAFGDRSAPVFVPPFSGFDERFFPLLERVDLTFSGFGPRPRKTEGGVTVINTHCELIEWADQPRFAEDSHYLGIIVEHLRGRRMQTYERDEPTGVLWHHKCQNDDSYAFLSKLVEAVSRHAAARWCDPTAGEVPPPPPPTRRAPWKTKLTRKFGWARDALA